MLYIHLLTKKFLNVVMLLITTHNLPIEVRFVRCTGPWLLWVATPPKFEMLWPKGQPIWYDKLMLGCAKRNLEESYLLPSFSNKANLCICSSILVEALCYHIPSIRNGDAAYAARAVTLWFKMAYQHLTTQWQHAGIPTGQGLVQGVDGIIATHHESYSFIIFLLPDSISWLQINFQNFLRRAPRLSSKTILSLLKYNNGHAQLTTTSACFIPANPYLGSQYYGVTCLIIHIHTK